MNPCARTYMQQINSLPEFKGHMWRRSFENVLLTWLKSVTNWKHASFYKSNQSFSNHLYHFIPERYTSLAENWGNLNFFFHCVILCGCLIFISDRVANRFVNVLTKLALWLCSLLLRPMMDVEVFLAFFPLGHGMVKCTARGCSFSRKSHWQLCLCPWKEIVTVKVWSVFDQK